MRTIFSTPRISKPEKFVPAIQQQRKNNKVSDYTKSKLSLPMYTVKELPGIYEVQVKIPGLKRETFTIYGNEHSLSIDAANGERLHKAIGMPANADTELTVAEYRNGILYLFVPKAGVSNHHLRTKIVVY